MKKHNKRTKRGSSFWIAGVALLTSMNLHAESPLWTFSVPSPARVSVSAGETSTIQYTVTNQSRKPKNLILRTTQGLSASPCYLAGKDSTCVLSLTINGSLIPVEGIHSGPVLCEQDNPEQCYQPGERNLLDITRSSPPFTDGHLELRQYGLPVSKLALAPGNNGELVLSNTGGKDVSSLSIQYPFGLQSYFTNNCPALLTPQQSCSIFYAIPTPSIVGIQSPLIIQGVGADNSITLPVSIQAIGALKCWGLNNYGQLGSTTNSGSGNANNSPLDVQTLSSGVAFITEGINHTCAQLNTGAVKCWGNNEFGQLGSTTNSGTTNPNNSPLDVQTLSSGVTSINAGSYHTCARLNTGAVKCWGNNEFGQLGSTTNSGTTNPNNSPLDVQGLSSGVMSISAGLYYSCALLDTGAVKCWGNNQYGQLGSTINSGTTNPNNSPLDVQGLSSGVRSISTGLYHSCALLDTGAVKCWGNNRYGQLGSTTNSGIATANDSPLDVQGLSSAVVSISTGANHTCARLNTGMVKCWGLNNYGQLGSTTNSGSTNPNNSPLDVQTLNSGVVSTSGGNAHTCALLNTGAAKCWGWNYWGQLGSVTNSGTNNPNNNPLDVQNLNLNGLVLFNHSLGNHSCAIVTGP